MANTNCSNIHESFLQLVRLGIGHTDSIDTSEIKRLSGAEWVQLKDLADSQGLSAVVLDGLNTAPSTSSGQVATNLTDGMPLEMKLEWIGEVLQNEAVFASQQKEAAKMADLFHQNNIRTYVLKGNVVAECYPNPVHRFSVDMDCFLLPENSDFDAWSLGNDLIKAQGFDVNFDYYKNSTFLLPGLTVENHQYMVPFRGNKKLTNLEILLQSYLRSDKGEDRIEGTYLYCPPVMVTALFLIEHAYSHFLHEGLTWRMILDWMMFSRKHQKEVDWYALDALIDEFGFRKFYESFYRLGKYLIGEIDDSGLNSRDKRMLNDVWAELDVHETITGVKGKLALVGNTLRARWKYHYFGDISMLHALWIQVKGFLFIKEPKLS